MVRASNSYFDVRSPRCILISVEYAVTTAETLCPIIMAKENVNLIKHSVLTTEETVENKA